MANERVQQYRLAEQGISATLQAFRDRSRNLTATPSSFDEIQNAQRTLTNGRSLATGITELLGLDTTTWRKLNLAHGPTDLYLGRTTSGGISSDTAEATVEIARLQDETGALKPAFLRVAALDRYESPRIVALTYDLSSFDLIRASISLAQGEHAALAKYISSADAKFLLQPSVPDLLPPYYAAGLITRAMYMQTNNSSGLRHPWLLMVDIESFGNNSRDFGSLFFDEVRQATHEVLRESGSYGGFEFSVEKVDGEFNLGLTPDGKGGPDYYSLSVPDRLVA